MYDGFAPAANTLNYVITPSQRAQLAAGTSAARVLTSNVTPLRDHRRVSLVCGCPRTNLCRTCLAGQWDNLRGVAACRGEVWAERVSARTNRSRLTPWPAYQGKAAAIARRKVSDLTDDPRLLEKLAAELARWAARCWSRPVELHTL